MFMLTSTHDRIIEKYRTFHIAQMARATGSIRELVDRVRAAHDLIRALQDELLAERQQRQREYVEKGDTQLTKEDIDALLRLCHPDRHGGRELATRMTQKLLRLRR